ncbi:MAG: hypothetical protein ACD_44C00092G0005 [uncultured bacterium]|nr:MAG: hypothetical protein ACD_44C00092G0005 [uncultured bacterium]
MSWDVYMRGIILAGGKSSRLFPATISMSKQLLPIYDKPLIYYPLSTLMLAGIRDILIITTPYDLPLFQRMLGDGLSLGIRLTYQTQSSPQGIAHAFILGESFIGNDTVCLILGDNLIYGEGLSNTLQKCTSLTQGSTIFGYYVRDPERYGVVEFDENQNPTRIIEKPKTPPSNYAVIGLYFYDNQVINIAKQLPFSARGELEITDINNYYLQQKQLQLIKLTRGTAWLDTGTADALLDAANFIQVLECRQGLKIGCPEEIAWRKEYISTTQLLSLAKAISSSDYGKYLLNLVTDHEIITI